MSTLLIYDSTGQIFSSPITGSYTTPQGSLQFLEVEIPGGKILTGVDTSVTPNVPVYEDIPQSDQEIADANIAALEAENANINYALMMGGLV
jgi:hypothetical protein